MAHYNFKQDIVVGEDGEKIVTEWLCDSYNGKLLADNKTNSHDVVIQFPKKTLSFEIKTDVFVSPYYDTGNMFIEYESRNKPSGISVCRADYFITYFKYLNELWMIKTTDLQNLINSVNFRIFKNAGDKGSNTHGYLIPRKKHQPNFKVVKIP
jgi:hypothetical protein